MATSLAVLEKRGLPQNLDAERTILGSILLNQFLINEVLEGLLPDDFFLDSHRRIFRRMQDLTERGLAIDIVNLPEELSRHKELESVGGIAYISSLTDGVPRRPSIEQYVKIVKDKAILRSLIHAADAAMTQAYDDSEPVEQIVDATEHAIFQISQQRIGKGFFNIPEIVKISFGSIDNLYQRGQLVTGVATHFTSLDEKTSGLQASDLIIIAARPSMGKTAFAINIAENAAIFDKRVTAIFSLEMSKESLLLRMLCSQARVDAHKLRTGFLSRDDRSKLLTALSALSESPLFIDDTPGISLMEMRAKLRRLQQQQRRLDLVVVDYLQLMAAGGRKYENRTQEVSAISRGLKMIAKELKVPVVALSQLSRAPETRGKDSRPVLSDLRESGSIEQDADVVAFIYREEYYKREDPDLEGIAEIIIAKQRNGPIGSVKLAFIKESTRFENMANEPPPREEY